MRLGLTAIAVGFLALFLVVPLVAVFAQALDKGWAAYVAALREPMALSALLLTLLTAAIAAAAFVLLSMVWVFSTLVKVNLCLQIGVEQCR